MIRSSRAVGGEQPGGFPQGDFYPLWLGGKPILSEARDWYINLAVACSRPVEICEFLQPLIGPGLAEAGIEARQVIAGKVDAEAADGDRVARFARWEKYPPGSPVGLVALPLGCIESAWRREVRLEALKRITGNLAGGGRLVLDARNGGRLPEEERYGVQRLALEQRDAAGGSLLLWESWRLAGAAKNVFELRLAAEAVTADGVVQKKRYARYLFASIEPTEMEADAKEAGLEVESLTGGFAGEPFRPGAGRQIWVFRKRGGDGR